MHLFCISSNIIYKTPFLINLKEKNFDTYLKSLSQSARRSYRYVTKENSDIAFSEIGFDPEKVSAFMRLWEEQIVYGRAIKWPFCIKYIKFLSKRKRLLCFAATCRESKEVLCVLFVERHGNYVAVHPPMYDKNKYTKRSIAKFMIFSLIEFAINETGIDWLDLDGGCNGSWRDLVTMFYEGKDNNYKWMYVPKEIKENPQFAESFIVRTNLLFYHKYLIKKQKFKFELMEILKTKFIHFLYWHKGQRLQKLREHIFER